MCACVSQRGAHRPASPVSHRRTARCSPFPGNASSAMRTRAPKHPLAQSQRQTAPRRTLHGLADPQTNRNGNPSALRAASLSRIVPAQLVICAPSITSTRASYVSSRASLLDWQLSSAGGVPTGADCRTRGGARGAACCETTGPAVHVVFPPTKSNISPSGTQKVTKSCALGADETTASSCGRLAVKNVRAPTTLLPPPSCCPPCNLLQVQQ